MYSNSSNNDNTQDTNKQANPAAFARHVACKTCRRRKVRCDGEEPACQKCQQAGEECLYTPPSRMTKADLAETLETVQYRLARAESALTVQDIQPHPSAFSTSSPADPPDIYGPPSFLFPGAWSAPQNPVSIEPQQYPLASRHSSLHHSDQHLLTSPTSMSLSAPNASIDAASMDFSLSSDDSLPMNHLLGPMSMPYSMASPPPSSLTTPFSAVRDSHNYNIRGNVFSPATVQRREQQEQYASAPALVSQTFPSPTTLKTPRIPSRRDIREWNAAAKQRQQQHRLSSVPTFRPQTLQTEPNLSGNGSGDNSHRTSNSGTDINTLSTSHSASPASLPHATVVAHHFSVLSRSLASTAADVSGIALALADYLAWARKHHPAVDFASKHLQHNQSGQQPQLENLFEIFEARAREIAGMVTEGTAGALEQAAGTLGPGDGGGARLGRRPVGEAEAPVAKAAGDRVEWFEETYEIGRRLKEQREGC